jgi:phage gp37-like protein
MEEAQLLAELEDGLIALVKTAPLGQKLATVAGLPDLDSASLVKRMAAEAPAVYVAPMDFSVADGYADARFGIACVARNSRGQEAARKGDGKAIGLAQIIDSVLALMDGGKADGVVFYVTGVSFQADEAFYAAGLYVATVAVEARAVELPPAIDETALTDFETFRASYDIEPHESATEHAKWAGDPPDHTTSAPDLSETVTLQP